MTETQGDIVTNWEGFFFLCSKTHPSIAKGLVKEAMDNALDAGADEVRWTYFPEFSRLVIEDNGAGMDWQAQKAFFTIFGTTKRGSGTHDIGQFGFGKGLYMISGQAIQIETRTKGSASTLKWNRINPGKFSERDDCEIRQPGSRFTIHNVGGDVRDELLRKLPDYVREYYNPQLGRVSVVLNGRRVAPLVHGQKPFRVKVRFREPAGGKRHETTLNLWWVERGLPAEHQGIGLTIGKSTAIREKLGMNWEEWNNMMGEVPADFLRDLVRVDKSSLVNSPLVEAFRAELRKKVSQFRLKHLKREPVTKAHWNEVSRSLTSLLRSINSEIPKQSGPLGLEELLDDPSAEEPEEPEPSGEDRPRPKKKRGGIRVDIRFKQEELPQRMAELQEKLLVIWANHPAFERVKKLKPLDNDPTRAQVSNDSGVLYHLISSAYFEFVRAGLIPATSTHETLETYEKYMSKWGEQAR
jgi:hypothetical protein